MGKLESFGWQGPLNCKGSTADGTACSQREIEGLEYCLHHVPDEDLDEAEEITGFRRCRHDFGQDGACHQYAVTGTEPPLCKNHGAQIGSTRRGFAEQRKIDDQVIQRLEQIMREDGDAAQVLEPPPLGDPRVALFELASEVVQLRKLLKRRVLALNESAWRYTRDKVGEQVRAEIVLWERAQDRSAKILVAIAKLKLEDEYARIERAKLDAIERALLMALQGSGATIDMQDKAKQILIRELPAAVE